MKINLGSGNNPIRGEGKEDWLNIDLHHPDADIHFDIEAYPWLYPEASNLMSSGMGMPQIVPIPESSVDEIMANHILEHVKDLPAVMKEIYRVCKNGARVSINVPHPTHDNWVGDPTHYTRILPDTLALFSKKNCAFWKQQGAANSPLADYLDVDFEFELVDTVQGKQPNIQWVLDPNFQQWEKDPGLQTMMRQYRNVVSEIKMVLVVIKEAANGDAS